VPLGSANQPTFGSVVQAGTPPPPLSGGTLLVTADGTYAVASDPEREAIYVVNLGGQTVEHTIALQAGDEPGRLVEDGAGRVHVALRSGGSLVTVDPASGSILARRSVCPAPRGVAWDAATDLVWVACATGELVALPAAGGSSTKSFVVERDLRDVVVSNGSLSVSSFRSAEVLRIATDGTVSRRDPLPSPLSTFVPHVAWRVLGAPSGAVVAVHQAATTQSLSTKVQGGYGGGCSGGLGLFPSPLLDASPLPLLEDGGFGNVPDDAGFPPIPADDASVEPAAAGEAGPALPATVGGSSETDAASGPNCFAGELGVTGDAGSGGASNLPGLGCGESGAVISILTVLTADGKATVNTPFSGVLPVDVAVSRDASLVAAVAPGNAFTAGLSTVVEFSSCGTPVSAPPPSLPNQFQPIAVAFDPANNLVVQMRQPAQLSILPARGASAITIPLSSSSRTDSGFDIFHTQAGGMIACASCHPEGRDDGNVWLLDNEQRRTPSLRGTIAGTAPYHWPGDEPNLDVLVNDVYTVRMSGATLNSDQMGVLNHWVQDVPALPAPSWVDGSAAQRGKTLFNDTSVGCATCHSGPKFTNNQTMNVGTGGSFQVPPLVGVGWRTPLFHNGCAASLADRFGACSTSQHGSIGSLSPGDISDLMTYLETL
jgi:hypothetical protein